MKTPLTSLAIALLCALPLWANSPKEPQRPPEGQQHETRMLQHLLQMETEDLANLRQTIERIERMTPEEKKLLRERIGKLDEMKPERVEAMRERFEAIPKETRDAMRQRWLDLSPEERQEWRKKLREMSPEERHEVLNKEGFLPVPGKEHKGKKPPRPPEE